jgi:pilus assembly protein Flp/PilA
VRQRLRHAQQARPTDRKIRNSTRINDGGATAIEYGLIASLIAIAIIAAATSLGTKLSGTFSNVANNLQ